MHSLGRENVENGGGDSKLVTVMTIIEVPYAVVITAGSPLTILSTNVAPPAVKVKVPGGDSVPAAYGSHILLSSEL